MWMGPRNSYGIRIIEADTPKLHRAEVDVRLKVFVHEQQVPFVLEVDARDQDPQVVHLVAQEESGAVVGAVRLIPDGHHQYHLGRLAVLKAHRGQGIGALLVQAIHQLVAEYTPRQVRATVVLDAQENAISFYNKQGYTLTERPAFEDAGIVHRTMSRMIQGAGTD